MKIYYEPYSVNNHAFGGTKKNTVDFIIREPFYMKTKKRGFYMENQLTTMLNDGKIKNSSFMDRHIGYYFIRCFFVILR